MTHTSQFARIHQKVTRWPQYFRLYQVAAPDVVDAIEAIHGFSLPSEYRHFLLEIGDGGEIEGWPLYTLTKAVSLADGLLSQPFPYAGVRMLDEGIESSLADTNGDIPMPGAVPIYYYGCTHSDVLVVTGSEAGTVWYDGRGIDFGFLPYTQSFPHPMDNPERGQPRAAEEKSVGFLDWYEKHLDKAEQLYKPAI